ncbi:MAG: DUF6057 family protein [Bacteroidales bacterium]|nr:DUF6057 family protein [Bacteroidales bacterium]
MGLSRTLLIFPVVAMFLLLLNSDFLYLVEQTNIVAVCTPGLLSNPFGAMQLAGSWLTQFFHYPVIGALILVAVWMAVLAILLNMCKLRSWSDTILSLPCIAMLWSVLNVGYWIYCSSMPGYFFSHSLSLLAMVLCIRFLPRNIWVSALVPLSLYPLLGIYSVALGMVLLYRCLRHPLPALSMLAVPMLWYFPYSQHCSLGDMYGAGFPLFSVAEYTDYLKSVPWVLAVLSVMFFVSIPQKILQSLNSRPWIPCSIAAICLLSALLESNHGSSFTREIRLVRMAMGNNWDGIVEDCEQNPKHTPAINAIYECALISRDLEGSHGFRINPRIVPNTECEALHVNTMLIAAPVLYMRYGMFNNSMRWSNELGVKYGFSIRLLQNMASASYLNGERTVARKFARILNHAIFYSNWTYEQHSVMATALHYDLPDNIGEDFNNITKYLRIVYNGNVRHGASQFTAANAAYQAMKLRNPDGFLQVVDSCGLPDGIHFQEAMCIFGSQKGRNIDTLPLATKFREFQSLIGQLESSRNQSLIAPIKKQYGDTYWWYVYFEK